MNDVVNENSSRGNNKSLLIFFVLLVLAAAGIGAWFYFEKGPGSPMTNSENTNNEVVARVNGVEIDREAYERSLEQLRAAYTAQGVDVSTATSSELLKEQAVEALVNRQLIVMAAEAKGLTVEAAAIDTEYQNAIQGAGGSEAFAAALAASNLSEEMVRADIANGLLIQQYLSTELRINELTVTDAEVESYYNTVKTTNPEVPPLAEVSAAIQSQLLTMKRDEAVNTALQSLRANAEIEVLI
ncbi:hypothetical protein A2837_02940 [Candidatus Kaiserbacteria bacterium RIFCSPHIGHO2_01_FULL_46_22]|uniref:PpiC domain-containing protein n=1 Tax=Candidatus Kaiserbacteria bacterium RIFCSPHIGHO2_01_FULL_46_22 TaxID=1798475 RepID=A0A1F6BWY9_9BACT|nr:MAG: hypothetical protein A2837_02940 [Candidatus Kaiserbacteria bacterium RIFCSPHIGHO2_01_FULL_46_22]